MCGPHSKYRLKSSQLLIAETEKQSTLLNCIIYPEEHNGAILSTYEARIKQLATPPNYIGPNNYSNPSAPWGLNIMYYPSFQIKDMGFDSTIQATFHEGEQKIWYLWEKSWEALLCYIVP